MRCKNSPARAKLLTLFETVSRGRTDLSLGDFDDTQVDWIIRSGLGPACFHAAKENQENFTSRHWQSLKAADLTARWIGADHREAMTEIIDASCLTGISATGSGIIGNSGKLSRDIPAILVRERPQVIFAQ